MNEGPPSLNELHDIVEPAGVDQWPLAPGAQLILLLFILAGGVWLWRKWKHNRANAYRAEALLQLEKADSALEVSIILRRCARIHCSAIELASMTQEQWLAFLESMGPSLPQDVKANWQTWVYEGGPVEGTGRMKTYAATWIRAHHFPEEKTA